MGKSWWAATSRPTKGEPAGHIVRLNTDGTVDSSFVTGVGFDGTSPRVQSFVVQPDGKILTAGRFATYKGETANNLIRLNADGSVDSSFAVGVGPNSVVNAMVRLGDGTVVIGGAFNKYQDSDAPRVIGIDTNGARSTSFAVSTGGNTAFDWDVNTLAVQADGKVLVGGRFTAPATWLTRLNADGSVDSGFPTGTRLRVAMPGPVDPQVYSVAVQPDGKIVVVGNFGFYGTASQANKANGVLRLLPNADRDTTFVSDGIHTDASTARSVLIQPDGQILMTGWFSMYDDQLARSAVRIIAGTPVFGADPATVGFGDVASGTSAEKAVTVTNTGDRGLAIRTVGLAGANAGEYAIASQTCTAAVVLPAATCTVTVRFSPTSAGAKNAELVFTDNTDQATHTVAVTGAGTSIAKPVAAKSLKGKATAKKVKVSWKSVAGATSYKVTMTGKSAKNKKLKKAKTTSRTSVSVKVKFKKRTKVKVCVVARNSAGSSPKVCKSLKVK